MDHPRIIHESFNKQDSVKIFTKVRNILTYAHLIIKWNERMITGQYNKKSCCEPFIKRH